MRSANGLSLTVVVPVYNERLVLGELVRETFQAIDATACVGEMVCVDDGSHDGSSDLLDELAQREPRLKVIHLARNFGHQAAVHAGLAHAPGDLVIVMDADLQDDPAAFPELVRQWEEGNDVVFAVRASRTENPIKKALFRSFYRVLGAISQRRIPNDAGNYGLMDRRVVDAVLELAERDRYLPGLRSWVGFRQVGVPIARRPRYDGTPRVSWSGLWRLAKSAIFSFSTVPLAVFYFIAAAALAVAFGLFAFTLYHKLFTGRAILGWTSGIMVACFFGALNALGIAVLGEYVVRIYDQVRARPLFVVDRTVNVDARTPSLLPRSAGESGRGGFTAD
jgi:glycosyltransferase involved in cell wall biosynthesis